MAATSEEARDLLSRHGECEPQIISDWSGTFNLPDALQGFYADVGPKDVCIEGYGNPTIIPALKHLWEFQAGYRWNGLTNKPIEDWPSDWLVVASEGGDPYIFDMKTNRILFAQHGTDEWDADEIYSDINTMAACIAVLGCVILESNNFEDEDCNINPECRKDAIERLTKILGDPTEAESVVETAGWG